MDPVEAALIEAVEAAADPTEARMVYLDWLQDARRSDQARFVRADLCFASMRAGEAGYEDAWIDLGEAAGAVDRGWMGRVALQYSVVLEGYPAGKKILVIRGIREIAGLGLKEAKARSEALPSVIIPAATGALAAALCDRLLAASPRPVGDAAILSLQQRASPAPRSERLRLYRYTLLANSDEPADIGAVEEAVAAVAAAAAAGDDPEQIGLVEAYVLRRRLRMERGVEARIWIRGSVADHDVGGGLCEP